MLAFFGLLIGICIAAIVTIIGFIQLWAYYHELDKSAERKQKELKKRETLEKIIKENEETNDE